MNFEIVAATPTVEEECRPTYWFMACCGIENLI
jgi:hypothetical protein